MRSARRFKWLVFIIMTLLGIISLLVIPKLFQDVALIDWNGIHWLSLTIALLVSFTLEFANAFCAWFALASFGYRRPFRAILFLTTAATSTNSVAPVPAGLPLRAWLQERILNIPWAVSIRALGCELLSGYGVVLSFAIGAAVYFGRSTIHASNSIWLMSAVLIAFLVCILIYIKRRSLKFWQAVLINDLRTAITAVTWLSGINVIIVLVSGGRILLQLAAVSASSITWTLFVSSCAALCLSRAASVLSFIPMGIGVREASLSAALVAFGVPLHLSVIVAITDRIIITVPYLSISASSAPYLTRQLSRPSTARNQWN